MYLNYDGTRTEFIVVHQGIPGSTYDSSCKGTWLMSYKCLYQSAWSTSGSNGYLPSTLNNGLNENVIRKLDTKVKNIVKQVKIPYSNVRGETVYSGANGYPCQAFVPSMIEVGYRSADVGYMPIEGAKLDYFESGTGASARDKRKAQYQSASYGWWLRSPYKGNQTEAWSIDGFGNSDTDGITVTRAVRPIIIIPSDIPVSKAGDLRPKTYTLSGTWQFNSALTPPQIGWDERWNGADVLFTNQYMTEVSGTGGIFIGYDFAQKSMYYRSSSYSRKYVYNTTTNTWTSDTCRTITFTDTQTVTHDFYDWFTSNAKQTS